MAEATANVIPLSATITKLMLINYDSPKTDGITSISYGGDSFNVVRTAINGGWMEVEATSADFDYKSRVIIEGDFPDPPTPPDPPEDDGFFLLEDGDELTLENNDNLLLEN